MSRLHSRPVDLSVVIPAHNSGELVEMTVRRLAERLRDRAAEIILVENGSSDDTYERCRTLAAKWPAGTNTSLKVLQSERGLGHALRAGAAESRGAHVLLTADDLPFGFDDLDAFDRLAAIGATPLVLIGSKAHAASRASRGAVRTGLTFGFAAFRRQLLNMKTGDPQGTFIVDGGLVRSVLPMIAENGFLFTTELAYVVELMGVRPVEVPVRLRREHHDHATRVTTRDALSMAIGLIRLRRRHRTRPRAVAAS